MKFLKIEGMIELPDELDTDRFIDSYLRFIESQKCFFGGGFEDVTSLEDAYRHTSDHRDKLEKDTLCGCFHCLKIFSPSEITSWLEEGSGTAICPYCGIDAVIGESAGHPITAAFLKKMNKHFF